VSAHQQLKKSFFELTRLTTFSNYFARNRSQLFSTLF
jgi:hypothetical protein